MRHRTWSWAALCACLLAAAALAHADNTADDALQPNFLPSSAAKNSLGGVFVEEQATVHAEEGSAAKLLAEIEAQSAAADAAAAAAPAQPQDDGPPPLSRADAESLTHTLMAALRGADPSQAFHEMMAERSTEEDSAPAAVAAPAPMAEPEETPAFLQQRETATAARMATIVGNKRFEVEDKAEDLSKEPAEDKEEQEEEHPDPYQLHHAQDAAPAEAAAAPAGWPYMAAPMMQQQAMDPSAAERFRQMSMMSNPYAALYQAYLQQFSQAGHHHKHRHHHKKADEDEPADKPASPAASGAGAASSSSSSDAMRFKEKESAKASDDDDEEDDDDDAGDADDDGDTDGEDDDDDDDGEERRRRERKRKQQQEKLKYDDAMNKMRFEQTQINLDVQNMKSFTSPRQSGYSAPVDATPVASPPSPAAIPLNPAAGGAVRQLFNVAPAPSYTAAYPQAAPVGASAYPSLIALSSTMQQQQVPQASAVNANPNGVPMPFFPPTSAPPPAPNQVPVAAQTVNGVYPPSMVMPSTAAMPFAADGLTQSPAVNPSAPTMNPNAPAAPGLSNYPFGGTNFLELESEPLPAIHAHVDAIARHPRHPHVRSRLTEQHFEPFPLL